MSRLPTGSNFQPGYPKISLELSVDELKVLYTALFLSRDKLKCGEANISKSVMTTVASLINDVVEPKNRVAIP